jgi:hypothetical protein
MFLYVGALHNVSNRLAITVFFARNFANTLTADKTTGYSCCLRRGNARSGVFWLVLAGFGGTRGFPMSRLGLRPTKVNSKTGVLVCLSVPRPRFGGHRRRIIPVPCVVKSRSLARNVSRYPSVPRNQSGSATIHRREEAIIMPGEICEALGSTEQGGLTNPTE